MIPRAIEDHTLVGVVGKSSSEAQPPPGLRESLRGVTSEDRKSRNLGVSKGCFFGGVLGYPEVFFDVFWR